jgi:digeranylgeranylglycerophospholipid reductase
LYDVIIIGAGPAGSYAAGQLAGAGHSVLVLEQKSGVGEKICCAGIVGRDCIKQFPVSEEVILRRANSARLFSPPGRVVRVWREQTQAYILNRPAFDRLLAERAMIAGAEYILNARAETVVPGDDRVDVVVSHQGKNRDMQAQAVVLATGFGSSLVRKLGTGRSTDFVMGAQAEVETGAPEETEVYFGREVAPGFFGWLVPNFPGRALVGVMSRRAPGVYLRRLISNLVAQGKIASDNVVISYGGIPLKPLPKTHGNRLLVVGDAAGQVKPTSGGGIYYGLLCAGIAADVLNRGLENGDLSAKALSEYEKRWRRKLGWELRIGYWTRKIYERLSDSQMDRLFHALDSHNIVASLGESEELSFDWHSKVTLRMARLLATRLVTGGIRRMKSPRS